MARGEAGGEVGVAGAGSRFNRWPVSSHHRLELSVIARSGPVVRPWVTIRRDCTDPPDRGCRYRVAPPSVSRAVQATYPGDSATDPSRATVSIRRIAAVSRSSSTSWLRSGWPVGW